MLDLRAPGFLWNDESTPANGPVLALSPGCQLLSRSAVVAGEPTLAQVGVLSV